MTLDILRAIASVVFLWLAAYGAGVPIRRLLPGDAPAWESIALQTLWGSGLLGLCLFLIGLLRFDRTVISGILLAPVVAALVFLFRHRSRFSLARPALPWWTWSVLLVFGSVAGILIFASLVSPSGSVDHIRYHLLEGKVWLRDGYVHVLPEQSQSAFPATFEILFAALMGLAGPRAPGLLSVTTSLLAAVLVAGVARRLGSSLPYALLAMALFFVLPAITPVITFAYADIYVTALTLAILRILLQAATAAQFAFAGTFAGFLIASKYTGLTTVGVTGLALLLGGPLHTPLRRRVTYVCVFGMTAAAIGLAWYIRNAVQLGCPIYPTPLALTPVCGTVRYLAPEALHEFHTYIMTWGGGRLGRTMGQFLLLPIRLSFQAWFLQTWWGELGTVPLALAPLAIWLGWTNVRLRFLAIWTFLFTLCWFLTEQEMRFLQAAIAIWIAIGIQAAPVLMNGPSQFGRLACAATLAASLAHGALLATSMHRSKATAVLRHSDTATYWSDVPDAEVIQYLNARPAGGQVLLVDPLFKPYYLDRRYLQYAGEHGERPFESMPLPDVLRNANRLGVTDVYVAAKQKPTTEPVLRELGFTPVLTMPRGVLYSRINRS